jgi:hypothetical protein
VTFGGRPRARGAGAIPVLSNAAIHDDRIRLKKLGADFSDVVYFMHYCRAAPDLFDHLILVVARQQSWVIGDPLIINDRLSSNTVDSALLGQPFRPDVTGRSPPGTITHD